MAASQLPAPGSTADPFSAEFFANQAALAHSLQQQQLANNQGIKETNAGYDYAHRLDLISEPRKLTADRNAANSQGLAESGVLAKTQAGTASQYAERAHRAVEARKAAVARLNTSSSNAVTNFNDQSGKNAASDLEKQRLELLENPPAPTAPYAAANPGGTRTVTGPAGPGGIVPYTEKLSNGGSVTVGPGSPITKFSRNPTTRARQIAANRALGVG